MQRNLIQGEYELPAQREADRKRWLPAFALAAIVVAATIALVMAGETASPVTVEVSR